MANMNVGGPPSAGANFSDLSKWYQDWGAKNAYNYGNYYQDQMKAAQDSTGQALNNYTGAVQGLQGLYGDLTNQASGAMGTASGQNQAAYGAGTQAMGDYNTAVQQMEALYGQLMNQAQGAMGQGQGQQNTANQWMQRAMGLYDPQQMQQNIASGTVPDATRNQLTQIRDLQMDSLMRDLDNVYGVEQRRVQDTLGGRGIMNSQTAANALSQMMRAKGDQVAQGSNTYNTQLAQGLIDAPYRQLEAGIQNLGAQSGAAQGLSGMASQWLQGQLSGLGSQAGWGAQIPGAVAQRFGMAQGLGNIANQNLAGQLQGLGAQAAWGAQIPQAIGQQYQMAKGMGDLPSTMFGQFSGQLGDIWKGLGTWSTELERAKMDAEARKYAADKGAGGSDGDWLNGIGGIIGAIGGLF